MLLQQGGIHTAPWPRVYVQPAERATRSTPAASRDVHRSVSDGRGQTVLPLGHGATYARVLGREGTSVVFPAVLPGTRTANASLTLTGARACPGPSAAAGGPLAEPLASLGLMPSSSLRGLRSPLLPLSPRPARKPHSNNPGLFLSVPHPLMSLHFFPSGQRPRCFEDCAFTRQGKGCPPGKRPAVHASMFHGTWLDTSRTACASVLPFPTFLAVRSHVFLCRNLGFVDCSGRTDLSFMARVLYFKFLPLFSFFLFFVACQERFITQAFHLLWQHFR